MKGLLALIAVALATPVAAWAQDRNAAAEEREARLALDAFGVCVAEQHPGESARVLIGDFRTSSYRTGLRMLANEGARNCTVETVGRGNGMRSSNLLMAGAIAEALLDRSGVAVSERILRAGEEVVPTYADSDTIAQCLARSLPEDVARLFASVPGDSGELTAVAPLYAAVQPCAQAAGIDSEFDISVPALRAMLATATLRLLIQSENPDA